MNPIVCLFPVIAMAAGGYKYLLLRRVRKHGDRDALYPNLIQPAVCGEMKVGEDATLLECLYRLAGEQGHWGFAQMLREKEAQIRALPPIDGVYAFVVPILMMEAHVYGPQFTAEKDRREALWMTPDEALAIEAVGLIEASRGLPPNSSRMLPDYRSALREVIAWQMGQ